MRFLRIHFTIRRMISVSHNWPLSCNAASKWWRYSERSGIALFRKVDSSCWLDHAAACWATRLPIALQSDLPWTCDLPGKWP